MREMVELTAKAFRAEGEFPCHLLRASAEGRSRSGKPGGGLLFKGSWAARLWKAMSPCAVQRTLQR